MATCGQKFEENKKCDREMGHEGHHCGPVIPSAKMEELAVGQKLFIRTVTFHYVGQVDKLTSEFVYLSDASWVADSGRFHTALKTGTLNEVEPMTFGAAVNRSSIVDFSPWVHALPNTAK